MDGEDHRTREARVERLWRTLDTRKEGSLSLESLKEGFRKINHRMHINAPSQRINAEVFVVALKNADSMLRDVMKNVDTNGDGHIEFSGLIQLVHALTWSLTKSQSFEPSLITPRRSFGDSSRASIVTTMANWTEKSSKLPLTDQAYTSRPKSLINFLKRLMQTTTA